MVKALLSRLDDAEAAVRAQALTSLSICAAPRRLRDTKHFPKKTLRIFSYKYDKNIIMILILIII